MMLFLAERAMDERTKKVLLVLCALFIIVLLIFGGIYALISNYMKKEQKTLDYYMYDLCLYRVVETKKQFMRAVHYHERRLMFNQAKWWLRLTILINIAFILVTIFVFNKDFTMMFTKAFELIPNVKFQTVGAINEALAEQIQAGAIGKINLPAWAPVSLIPSFISKDPNYAAPELWISTAYYVLMIVFVLGITGSILSHIARLSRGRNKSITAFQKDLDKVQINANKSLDNL